LSWAGGDSANKTFSVPIINDGIHEDDETLTLTLRSPTGGATIGSPGTVTLTIIDDDPENRIWNIDMTPSSPASLEFDERVNITFNYHADESGGVRLFCIPYTNGSITPNSTVNGSPLYDAGDGTGDGFITVTSGGVTVDQIRVYMTNADQSQTLFETFIDVSYTFGPGIDVIGTWTLEFDWECDEVSVGTTPIIFNSNGTFTMPDWDYSGPWTLNGSQITFRIINDSDYNTVYTGTVSDDYIDGTMSNDANETGCWTAARRGSILLFGDSINNGDSTPDPNGNPLAP
jgi:hypothetical protein